VEDCAPVEWNPQVFFKHLLCFSYSYWHSRNSTAASQWKGYHRIMIHTDCCFLGHATFQYEWRIVSLL